MLPMTARRRIPSTAFTTCLVLLTGCFEGASKPPTPHFDPVKRLTIVTPHGEKIRTAFEVGFNEWYGRQKEGRYVRFDWVEMGTPQCIRYVEDVFTLVRDEKPHRIPDLVFGGGISDHAVLADRNYCRPLDLNDLIKDLPAEVGGLPTRDSENRWFSTGLSSFGILFNREMCE
ncbi:MAG: hypothetical protein V3T70_10870, partial [Phycisphaerae bacterium]